MLIYESPVPIPSYLPGAMAEALEEPDRVVTMQINGHQAVQTILAMNCQRHLDAVASFTNPEMENVPELRGVGLLPFIGFTIRMEGFDPMGAAQFLDIYSKVAKVVKPIRSIEAVTIDIYSDHEPLLSGFGMLIAALASPIRVVGKSARDRVHAAAFWVANEVMRPRPRALEMRGLTVDTLFRLSDVAEVREDENRILTVARELATYPKSERIKRGSEL